MSNGDYGYFGKGDTGYAQYMTAFNRNFGGSSGGGLEHPDWRENLKLACAVQETLYAKYPTLMRPVTVRNSRYNQQVTTGSLLIEVGTAGNSLDEALAAARLFAAGFAETVLA